MEAIGWQVEQVPIAIDPLPAANPQRFMFTAGPFRRNNLYSAAKLQRDVPEFQPKITLQKGITDALEYLDREGLLEEMQEGDWEDQMIAIQKSAAGQIAQVKV